jgi:hypothetical protein
MNPRYYAESDPYKSDEIFKRLKVGVSFTYLGIEMIVTVKWHSLHRYTFHAFLVF